MSPDELRAHADLIADRYNIQDGEPALWRAMVHVVQAARNLADVIEYAERIAGSNRADSPYVLERASHQSALRILAIARGDTTNENRSE